MMTMASTPRMDNVCAAAVETARIAAGDATNPAEIGEHLGVRAEGDRLVVHRFRAEKLGYVGWEWAVTVARAPRARVATVCEVVLLPGEAALRAPEWLPWSERIRPGDVGVGDIVPTDPDDDRLVPALAAYEPELDDENDPAIGFELGIGRARVMSRLGRDEAVERWYASTAGPSSGLAQHAPAHCAGCGFFLPLAGSLRAVFGVCGNVFAPDDGRVVAVDHGCGAHSEALVQATAPASGPPVAVDDTEMDLVKAHSGAGSVNGTTDEEALGHG